MIFDENRNKGFYIMLFGIVEFSCNPITFKKEGKLTILTTSSFLILLQYCVIS